MEYTRHYASPLGGILLASDGEALTGLWFDGQAHFGATLTRGQAARAEDARPGQDTREPEPPTPSVFKETVRWLDCYFSGREPDFTPPLRPRGTPFRRAVWALLLTVPYGETVSYGELAARLAEQEDFPRISAQAVGGAVGHNPISLLIPCHRVLGAGGSLTGYAGGLGRKRRLLELERAKIREP